MECDKEFDDSKRTSDFWKKQYSSMGACADICNSCWIKEYGIDVSDKQKPLNYVAIKDSNFG